MNHQKLGIYIPYFTNKPAGLERYMRESLHHILKYDAEVIVYTADSQHIPHGLKARILPELNILPMKSGIARRLSRTLWMQHTLGAMLRRDKCQALLSLFHEGMFNPVIPQTLVIHDLMPLLLHYQRSAFLVFYYRYILPKIMQRSSVVAVSNNTKRDIQKEYQYTRTIDVIYEGYNTDIFNATGRKLSLAPTLFYVGTHWPHKNLERLLYAFARIKALVPHTLVIAGPTHQHYTPLLQSISRQLHIEQRVSWTAYLSLPMLAMLYRSVDCFVYPSLYEGFGLPPLEALASGSVVVTSNSSSLPEVVGDAALSFNPLSIEQLSDQLLRACTDSDLRLDLIQRGFVQAQKFSWHKTARELLQVMQRPMR